LPHYISADMNIADEYHWKLKLLFGLWNYTISYRNIKYDTPQLDLRDTKIIFEDVFGQQMLKVDFPAIKKWQISALQHWDSFLIPDSEIYLLFEDFDVKFNANFGITDEGYLKPVVYQTDLKWGRSDFFHENWFVQFISFNAIKYAMVMI
jgi:hypothetical protein